MTEMLFRAMAAPYTDITFTNAREGGITAKKLNKLRDDLSTAISSGGAGTGDMTKAVYDTNANNVVDTCDSLAWAKLTGVPSTFPPDSTAMLKSVYDTNGDGVSDHAALADTAPWTGITGKPATFPPDSTAMLKSVYDTNANNVVDTCDSLAWGKLTGVPTTFTPAAHFATHLDNGSDPIPVATTSRTGSLRTLNGTATTFLDGTGNWSTPAPGGTVNPGTWTALTYSTGWTQNTAAQFRVETNGSFQKVIAQGIINYASGAASLAFTLPAGARPGVTRGCVLAGFDSSGDVLLFSAQVSVAGAVTILPLVRQAFVWPSATNGSVYLDNLTFAL
jgi:hypothetical protein